MSAAGIDLPTGADVRIIVGFPEVVLVITQEGRTANLEDFTKAGECSLVLTHDAGVTWPDRKGVMLAKAALADGWPMMLQFENLADALACRRRLSSGTKSRDGNLSSTARGML